MLDFIYNFDLSVFNKVFELHGEALNTVMKVITQLGDGGVVWIVLAILLLLFRKTRKVGLMMAGALVVMVVCNDLVLKNLLSRPRPFNYLPWQEAGLYTYPDIIARPTSFSFPSGHTSSSFAAATAIFANNKKWGIAAYVMAAAIAFSRIYCGVHYCTDILGGIVVGVIYGLAGVAIAKAVLKLIKKKSPKAAAYFNTKD